jgi:predicted transcriptional regulator
MGLCSVVSAVRARINSPKVIHQIFETEVVIVNLETGNYYSVTNSGIQIWQQLDAGISFEEIIQHFPGVEQQQVGAFLAELEREELIVSDQNRETRSSSSTPAGFSKGLPRLEKFTDMRDLLLVDPIHELDESGWPKPAPIREER